MNNAAAGKVVIAQDPEPALPVPRPMGDDGVNDAGDEDRIDDVGDEVASFGQRARHQRGRRGREHELEEPLGQLVC